MDINELLKTLPENDSSETWKYSEKSLKNLTELLEQRRTFYCERNAHMTELFKELKLTDELEELVQQIAMQPKKSNLSQNSFEAQFKALQHEDTLLKHKCTIDKLKIAIKYYSNLNETLRNNLKRIHWEVEQSEKDLHDLTTISSNEIRQLQEKAVKYEGEALKFEKRYPWLTDPEFSIPNISKEIQKLNGFRAEKTRLLHELNVYKGLKPDLQTAQEQLERIKQEYNELLGKLVEK